jgi:hypothetical protein
MSDILSSSITVKELILAFIFALIVERLVKFAPRTFARFVDSVAARSQQWKRYRIARLERKVILLRRILSDPEYKERKLFDSDTNMMRDSLYILICLLTVIALSIPYFLGNIAIVLNGTPHILFTIYIAFNLIFCIYLLINFQTEVTRRREVASADEKVPELETRINRLKGVVSPPTNDSPDPT